MIYLFESQKERMRLFRSQTAAVLQEPGTPSGLPTWMSAAQTLGPFSVAFSDQQ